VDLTMVAVSSQVYLIAINYGKSHLIYCHPFHEDELINISTYLINLSFLEFTPLLSLGSLVNLINADFLFSSR
jgi:hypothetical protein